MLNATAGSGFVTTAAKVRPEYLNISAYAQDTWKLTPRLTLNLGLRWEINPAPGDALGNHPLAVTEIDNLATMQLAPNGTSQWQTTYVNFAPRVGVAYQLKRQSGRETILRGGFGVFYDTGNNQASAVFVNNYPFFISRPLTNVTYPLSPTQVAPPLLPDVSNLTPPYGTITVFDPHLNLPYTLQWNLTLEQSLGKSQAITMAYVGSAGRKLLQRRQLSLAAINPKFTTVNLTTNKATSDYNALQAKFQRRLSRGLQVLASYTWSHALDEDSVDNATIIPVRGNAAFDIRHVFASAITYDIPRPGQNRFLNAVFGHWSIDTNVHAQSAAPVDIIASQVVNPADGTLVGNRPILIAGIPLYLYGPQYPGGRIINNTVPTAAQIAGAGCAPAGTAKGPFCTPPTGQFGNLGRNQVRGLGAWQTDFALRRQFKLTEKVNLQLRAEAFNIFNHPNFGAISTTLTAANFGQATNMLNRQLGGISQLYQIGGPRSMQFALKLQF